MQNFFTANARTLQVMQAAQNSAQQQIARINVQAKNKRNAALQQLQQQYVQQYAAQHNVHNVVALNSKNSYKSCISTQAYAHAIASVKSVYALHKRTHYKNAQRKIIARIY